VIDRKGHFLLLVVLTSYTYYLSSISEKGKYVISYTLIISWNSFS